jgi:hypothetical protein
VRIWKTIKQMKRRLKRGQTNDKDKQSFKEIFFETLKEFISKIFLYIILSLVVYSIGIFSWWIGFILFSILAVCMLSESLLVGVVAFLEIFVSYLIFSVILRYKNKKFDTEDFFPYVLGLAVLGILFSFSLLALSYCLFVFFFPSSYLI